MVVVKPECISDDESFTIKDELISSKNLITTESGDVNDRGKAISTDIPENSDVTTDVESDCSYEEETFNSDFEAEEVSLFHNI